MKGMVHNGLDIKGETLFMPAIYSHLLGVNYFDQIVLEVCRSFDG